MIRSFIIMLCLFFSVQLSIAQMVGGKDRKALSPMENAVLKFTELTNRKADADSVVRLCGFPLYAIADTMTIFNSAAVFKHFFIKNNKKKSQRPSVYKVDTVYTFDSYIDVPQQLVGKVTFVYIGLFFPYVGEGALGQKLNGVFFVEKKYPYRIFGFKEID